MKNILTRSLSGIIYIALIVGAILWGTTGVFLLALLFCTLAVNEFMCITTGSRFGNPTWLLDIIGGLLLTASIGILTLIESINPGLLLLFLVWFLWLMGRWICALYFKEGNQLLQVGMSMTAQLYLALPLGILTMVNSMSAPVCMLMFILIWVNDTGAFLFGSKFGKRRLFERISPKKSWEGFFGGIALAMGFAIGAHFIFPHWFHQAGWLGWCVFGLIVGLFATFGDLFESLVKRTVGVKDSGTIMPGHGGILDRIDSLLFVSLATFIFLLIARFNDL